MVPNPGLVTVLKKFRFAWNVQLPGTTSLHAERRARCDAPVVIALAPVVREKAVAFGAQDWLDALPGLLAEVAAEWSLTITGSLGGGTEALVAAVTLDDGTAAVLKAPIPRDDEPARREAIALRLAAGTGCARLLRYDERRQVLLLERLGRPLEAMAVGRQQRDEILCATVRRVWRPAADCGLPTGADAGRWLSNWITTAWEETGRPCSAHAVEYALACAARRVAAHDDERAVLVHGDVHASNTLEGTDGFKLIDPNGLLAEPEYDLGVILREDPIELIRGDPHARARWIAARTGRNATAIWEWSVAERVSTGLLATRVDLQPVGRLLLAGADQIAGAV